jgi:hypothetical protein
VRPTKLIPKRLAVWLIKIVCQILILGLCVITLLGHGAYGFG